MLARRRAIRLNGQEVERTPLLVPSFSSKGFRDVRKYIEYSSEVIEGPMLVSSYDLYYDKIEPPFDFASLLFLDSGGYEASKDGDLSDFGDKEHIPKEWSQNMHEGILANWKPTVPTVVISYDHPKARLPVQEQIARAKAMAPGRADVMREILLKPETETQKLLQIESIIENIDDLGEFSVVGVTEKEVGNSVLSRMQNIAKLRLALDKSNPDLPLHVFGSLDTVTTPLYFLAGADIFDGLTWLRFAFHEGQTLYKQNYGALNLPIKTSAHVVEGLCWNHNYSYISDLELEMRRFLNAGDFASFRYHGEEFRAALESVKESVGG